MTKNITFCPKRFCIESSREWTAIGQTIRLDADKDEQNPEV